jgi:hypothetical protein
MLVHAKTLACLATPSSSSVFALGLLSLLLLLTGCPEVC